MSLHETQVRVPDEIWFEFIENIGKDSRGEKKQISANQMMNRLIVKYNEEHKE